MSLSWSKGATTFTNATEFATVLTDPGSLTRPLLVAVVNFWEYGDLPFEPSAVDEVTLDGTPMTRLCGAQDSLGGTEVWYTTALGSGDQDVVASFVLVSGETVSGSLYLFLFQDVDQSTPIPHYAAANGNSTTPSVTVTGQKSANKVFDTGRQYGGTAITSVAVGADQTNEWGISSFAHSIGTSPDRGRTYSSSQTSTDGSVVMDWTLGAAKMWTHVGWEVREYAAPLARSASASLTGSAALARVVRAPRSPAATMTVAPTTTRLMKAQRTAAATATLAPVATRVGVIQRAIAVTLEAVAATARALRLPRTVEAKFTYSPGHNGYLDDFNRADGDPADAIHPWVEAYGAAAISSNEIALTEDCDLVYDLAFGPDQEVSAKLANDSWPSQALIYLKRQGAGQFDAVAAVHYDNGPGKIVLETYGSEDWQTREEWSSIALVSGDRLAAHAYPSGLVDVFVNGALIGTGDLSSTAYGASGAWEHATAGGRIGLGWWGTNVTTFRMDDFGGGDAVYAKASVSRAIVMGRAAAATAAFAGAVSRALRLPRLVAAVAEMVPTVARATTLARIVVATAVLTADVLLGSAISITVAAVAEFSGAVSRVTTALRSAAATVALSPVVSRVSTLARAISASSAFVGVASRAATLARTVSAGAEFVAAAVRTATMARTAAAVTELLPAASRAAVFARLVTAGAVLVAETVRVAVLARTAAAVMEGVATVSRVLTAARQVSATLVGVATVALGSAIAIVITATASFSPAVSRLATAFRTISATAAFDAAVSRLATVARAIAATAAFTAAAARARRLARTVSAVSEWVADATASLATTVIAIAVNASMTMVATASRTATLARAAAAQVRLLAVTIRQKRLLRSVSAIARLHGVTRIGLTLQIYAKSMSEYLKHKLYWDHWIDLDNRIEQIKKRIRGGHGSD